MAKPRMVILFTLGGLSLVVILAVIGRLLIENEPQAGRISEVREPTYIPEIDEPNKPIGATASTKKEPPITANDRGQLDFAELIEQADSGDAVAQYDAYKVLGECNGLQDASSVQEMIDTSSNVGAPLSDEYQEYLWSMHSMCRTIPLENLREKASHYLSLAQQSNFPAAVARQLIAMAEERGIGAADVLALEILKSGDPEAIVNTRPYVYYRYNSLPIDQLSNALDKDVVDAALLIWSCNLGWDQCAPGSHLRIKDCSVTRQENCNPNESLLAYASHAMWTSDVENRARMLAREWQLAVENGESPKIFVGEVE